MACTEQELKNELDMLKGNINRIMVSEDVREISDMFSFATRRLALIYRERIDEVYRNKPQFIPPETSPDELPFG